MNRTDLILTTGARVARITLAPHELSPKHLHSEVIENVVCLIGCIEVYEFDANTRVTKLMPGQIHEIGAKVVHQLMNVSETDSEYLLIQNGIYDFVAVNA